MENDVGLDDLILKDKQDRKKDRSERTQINRTKRIEKNHRRDDNRDRQRGRNHHNREHQHRSKFEDRLQDRFQDRPRDFQENRGYTLLIKGFVADVSTDDIFKLLKGKKIYKISAFLENESRNIIEYQKEMPLDVKIKFHNKEDADDFMQQYSNKLLDGKHSLTFSFVRS